MSSLDTTIRAPDETPAFARSVQGGTFALFVLSGMHFVVDTVASQVTPLWPTLKEHYQVPTFWMLCVWGLASSFSQLGFAMIGDRAASRWLVWLGPATCCVCLGCLGLFDHFLALGFLLTMAGMGIAAFHPEGATLSGNCWPNARSRAVSIFAMGGFLGQSVGPPCSGWIVDHYGLRALTGGIAIGLALMIVMRLAYRPVTPTVGSKKLIPIASEGKHSETSCLETSPPTDRPRLRFGSASRRSLMLLLLLAGASRVIAASGVPIALAYWLKSLKCSETEIGWMQSAFLGGIGLGGLLCAIIVRPRLERLVLWFVPLLSVPCLLAMPSLQGLWLSAASLATGLLLGMAQPVFISYGQQLFPETQRVASSITMGLSWGIGGAIAAALIDFCDRRQSFDIVFVAFAAAVVVSSVLCVLLPKAK